MVADNRGRPVGRKEESPRDPSPEEIRQRAAQIRKRWDSQTRERRSVQSARKPWFPPGIVVADIVANAIQRDSN